MARYRKTKDGQWVVFGTTTEVKVGSVTVTKADGSQKTEQVVSLGNTFNVDGKLCVYGYLAAKTSTPKTSTPKTSARPARRYECPECGDYVFPGTRCWETGCIH